MPRYGAPGSAQRAHGIVKPDRAPAKTAPPPSAKTAPPPSSSGSAEEAADGVPESEGGSGTPSGPTEPQKSSQSPQQPAKSSSPTVAVGGGNGVASSGAGFLLGLVFWGWIALPFLKGGPQGVKNMLKAKFLNKAPDGSWLP